MALNKLNFMVMFDLTAALKRFRQIQATLFLQTHDDFDTALNINRITLASDEDL